MTMMAKGKTCHFLDARHASELGLNAKLKKLLVQAMLDNARLKDGWLGRFGLFLRCCLLQTARPHVL
jgi:hypothetical protein